MRPFVLKRHNLVVGKFTRLVWSTLDDTGFKAGTREDAIQRSDLAIYSQAFDLPATIINVIIYQRQ